MSRRALWSPQAHKAAPAPAGPTEPNPAHGAPGGVLSPLRVRSGVDLNVKLARLADLLVEAGGIVRELSQVQLDDARDSRLMSHVETTTIPARILTVNDVAERLALAPRTVRRMRQRGEIPAGIEIGGVLRWKPEEIDAWLASGGRA